MYSNDALIMAFDVKRTNMYMKWSIIGRSFKDSVF